MSQRVMFSIRLNNNLILVCMLEDDCIAMKNKLHMRCVDIQFGFMSGTVKSKQLINLFETVKKNAPNKFHLKL